jgi:hypothetical protein
MISVAIREEARPRPSDTERRSHRQGGRRFHELVRPGELHRWTRLVPDRAYSDPLGALDHQTKQLTSKNEKTMKHILTAFNLIGAFALLALAVGCSSTQTQSKENLLIAAGFKVIVPHTAALATKAPSTSG